MGDMRSVIKMGFGVFGGRPSNFRYADRHHHFDSPPYTVGGLGFILYSTKVALRDDQISRGYSAFRAW